MVHLCRILIVLVGIVVLDRLVEGGLCTYYSQCQKVGYRSQKYHTKCKLFGWSRCTRYRREKYTYTQACKHSRCCSGYVGSSCSQDINECSSHNGGCNHHCTNSHGSFKCSCNKGYSLQSNKKTCVDINECSSYNGGCNQVCRNSAGSYRCHCHTGYSLGSDKKTCSDINECLNKNGGCSHTCKNTAGSYTCHCRSGFTLQSDQKTCSDTNECKRHNGGCQQLCANEHASFHCECKSGYQLQKDGKSCSDINECHRNSRCSHICHNTVGSYKCSCRPGYILGSDGNSCQDGPNMVIITPSTQSYTLKETENLNQIQCTADCMPVCTMTWSGPNLPAGTTSVLILQKINRNQTGDYQCTASNDVSSKKSVVVNVVVHYGPIQIEISPPDSTYIVTETDSINQITCTADCNPSCTTTWTGPNLSAGSTFILNLTSIGRSQAGVYNCTAVNEISSLTLSKVNVIVNYGPRQVVIYPTTFSYTRNETLDSLGPINCTANCKPACTSTWNGPNLPPGTTSVLSLANINRNQAGNYQCTASNDVRSLISATIYVVVNYQPTISSISNNKVVNENDTATIDCTVDSIPQSAIRWIFETKELQNNYDGSLTLNKIECLSKGKYTCQAVNMLGVDNRYVDVTVKCSPRINYAEFTIPSTITVKDGEMLNITVYIIAFPKPEMYWQFGQNGLNINVSSGISNSFNINRHSSSLVKRNLVETDFGIYHLYAYNGVGNTQYFLHSFIVLPERQYLASPTSTDQSGLFTAGISCLIIGLLSIIFAVSFVIYCRFRPQKRKPMSNNEYTEFETCNPRPVVTNQYDILNTAIMGTNDEHENQTDRNSHTYEECQPSNNTDRTYRNQNIQSTGATKKKEHIYDNMKI